MKILAWRLWFIISVHDIIDKMVNVVRVVSEHWYVNDLKHVFENKQYTIPLTNCVKLTQDDTSGDKIFLNTGHNV